MALIQNDLGEFVDNFDPFETDRRKIYANCHVDTKYPPSHAEPYKQREPKKSKLLDCPWCGKPFSSEENARRYCSKECKRLAMNKRNRDRYYANKAKGGKR